MNIAKAVQMIDLFYDLKEEFISQFMRVVEEKTPANLEKLRNRIDSEPPESLDEPLRDQFIKGIDVMLSMAR